MSCLMPSLQERAFAHTSMSGLKPSHLRIARVQDQPTAERPLRSPGLRSARHGPCSRCTQEHDTQKTSGSISPQRFCRLHRYFRILANPCSLSAPFTPKPSAAISNPSRPSRAAFSSAHGARSRLHRRAPRHCTSTAARLPTTRSSVGSVTTLSNLLRMLYSRAGNYPPQTPMLCAEDFCPPPPGRHLPRMPRPGPHSCRQRTDHGARFLAEPSASAPRSLASFEHSPCSAKSV